jgi:hypothetical protein
MAREDAEGFLRTMTAPLSAARRGEPLPGVPFSREAVANAFVMLGLLPESRAEEILAEYRPALEAKGLQIGVLTGELSVRPGAHGFQDARAAGRDGLARIPLAVAAGPVPIASDGMDLSLTWATLTPGGALLRLRATRPGTGGMSQPRLRGHRVPPGYQFGEEIRSGLSVTDDLGQRYQVWPVRERGTLMSGRPGERAQRWDGEMLAEPEPRDAESSAVRAVRWLEFAMASGPPARVVMPASDGAATGAADPPWPTPAECYLAVLASVTSMSIGADGGTAELDTAQIVAAVADALLWTGALLPDSALLSGGTAAGVGHLGWREPLVHLWGRHARQRARAAEPDRAGLAVRLPLRQATAVIESITAHEDLVSVQLYGHPWVTGEYWPMIAPCFQVRAVDDTGGEHEGVPGSGGGSPEGSWEFSFWPPVAPAAKRIRVIVSTLWEAAWAEIDIPGRSA